MSGAKSAILVGGHSLAGAGGAGLGAAASSGIVAGSGASAAVATGSGATAAIATGATSGSAVAGGAAAGSILAGGAVLIGAVVIAGVAYQGAKIVAEEARKAELAHHKRSVHKSADEIAKATEHQAISRWATDPDKIALQNLKEQASDIPVAWNDLQSARLSSAKAADMMRTALKLVNTAEQKQNTLDKCDELLTTLFTMLPSRTIAARSKWHEEATSMVEALRCKNSLTSSATKNDLHRAQSLLEQGEKLYLALNNLEHLDRYIGEISSHSWSPDDNDLVQELCADPSLAPDKVLMRQQELAKMYDQSFLEHLKRTGGETQQQRDARTSALGELQRWLNEKQQNLYDLEEIATGLIDSPSLQKARRELLDQFLTLEQQIPALVASGEQESLRDQVKRLEDKLAKFPELIALEEANALARQEEFLQIRHQINDELERIIDLAKQVTLLPAQQDNLSLLREEANELTHSPVDSYTLKTAQELQTRATNLARELQAARVLNTVRDSLVPSETWREQRPKATVLLLERTEETDSKTPFRSLRLESSPEEIRLSAERDDGETAECVVEVQETGAIRFRTLGEVAEGSASCESFKRLIASEELREFAQLLDLELFDQAGNPLLAQEQSRTKKRTAELNQLSRSING